jgi:hypothetical protein
VQLEAFENIFFDLKIMGQGFMNGKKWLNEEETLRTKEEI